MITYLPSRHRGRTHSSAGTHQWFGQLANLDLNSVTATVQKIITEILPSSSGLTFAKDARDLLIECCVEFITLISSEANDIAEKEAKKTIACDHVEKALKELGFDEYVQEVLDVASEHKEQLKVGDRMHAKGRC